MSLGVNNNVSALNVWRNIATADRMAGVAMERLSSGLRINRAADDPSGLVIAEKMQAQLSGLGAAAKNVEKATNMIATTEAALDKVNSLLLKMRALAIDSANLGVNDANALQANQDELDELIDSIDRITEYARFNGKKLLDVFERTTKQVLAPGPPSVIGSALSAGLSSVSGGVVGDTFQVGAVGPHLALRLPTGETALWHQDNGVAGSYHTDTASASDLPADLSFSFDYDGTVLPKINKSSLNISFIAGPLVNVDLITPGDDWIFQVGANESQFAVFTPRNTHTDRLGVVTDPAGISYTRADGTEAFGTIFQNDDGVIHLGMLRSDTGAYVDGVFAQQDSPSEKSDAIAQALAIIDEAVDDIASYRGKLGAMQSNSLEPQHDALLQSYEYLQTAESTIRDADMARETANFVKNTIKVQSGIAMLSQANQLPAYILQLLETSAHEPPPATTAALSADSV